MFGNTDGMRPLFNFLQTLQFKGQPLMINKRIESTQQLEDALSLAVEYLSSITDEVLPLGATPRHLTIIVPPVN